MKHTMTLSLAVVGLAGLCALGGLPVVYAGAPCTEASLQGTYGFLFNGVGGPDLLPFAAVGIGTFDGQGHLSGVASSSNNGVIRNWVPFQGTYTIHPDCTGADEVIFEGGDTPFVHEFVLVDGGNELRLLSTSGGANIAVFKRLGRRTCSEARFSGAYGYNGYGKIIQPEPGDIAFMGRMVADGAGYFEGGDTIMRNGERLERTYTAEYVVKADCTGSYEADTTLGIVHSHFVIVGNGEELLVLRSDAGQVLTFTFKRQ